MKRFHIAALLLLAASLTAFVALSAPALATSSGHIAGLSVVDQNSTIGGVADIYLEIRPGSGAVYIESLPLTKIDTQISTRLAKEAACQRTTKNCDDYDFFYVINVPSSVIGGPSAGGAISVLTYSLLEDLPLRNDTAMTGTIMSGGIIGPVGGVQAKIAGAAAAGYSRVLIPAWEDNETGIPVSDRYNVSVIRIRTLDEAIFYFTGKQPEVLKETPPPEGYVKSMSKVSDTLCERAAMLAAQAANITDANVTDKVAGNGTVSDNTNYTNSTNATDNITVQYTRGLEAQARGSYYSAASLCFSSSLQSQTRLMQNKSLKERRAVLGKIIVDRGGLETTLHSYKVESIADLEISLIITERLEDVKKSVSEMNTSNPDAVQLAYAQERLHTAQAWYTLLGEIESKKVEITDAQLAQSCKQKLEEAQERINYLSYLYPAYTAGLEDNLRTAFTSAQRQEYSLCLLQASQAKAEANSLLTALYVPESELSGVISEKLLASQQQLSKQTQAGTFPILGYSYSEYSKELAQSEPYSSLLYTEYSLELGALDIYFPPQHKRKAIVDQQMLIVFVTGALLGGIAGVAFSSVFQKREKPHRPKSATPKRNAPGKKR